MASPLYSVSSLPPFIAWAGSNARGPFHRDTGRKAIECPRSCQIVYALSGTGRLRGPYVGFRFQCCVPAYVTSIRLTPEIQPFLDFERHIDAEVQVVPFDQAV